MPTNVAKDGTERAQSECSNAMQPHKDRHIKGQNGQTASNCGTISQVKPGLTTVSTLLYLLPQLGGLASYAAPHGSAAHPAQSLLEVQVESKPFNWCWREKRTRSWTRPVAFPRVRPLIHSSQSTTTFTALRVRHAVLPSCQWTSHHWCFSLSAFRTGLFIRNPNWWGGSNKVASECWLEQSNCHLVISNFEHKHSHGQDQNHDHDQD